MPAIQDDFIKRLYKKARRGYRPRDNVTLSHAFEHVNKHIRQHRRANISYLARSPADIEQVCRLLVHSFYRHLRNNELQTTNTSGHSQPTPLNETPRPETPRPETPRPETPRPVTPSNDTPTSPSRSSDSSPLSSPPSHSSPPSSDSYPLSIRTYRTPISCTTPKAQAKGSTQSSSSGRAATSNTPVPENRLEAEMASVPEEPPTRRLRRRPQVDYRFKSKYSWLERLE